MEWSAKKDSGGGKERCGERRGEEDARIRFAAVVWKSHQGDLEEHWWYKYPA